MAQNPIGYQTAQPFRLELIDAEARAMHFRASHSIPSFDQRYQLKVGDTVKLGFIIPADHPARRTGGQKDERLLVEITGAHGACGLVGVLLERPAYLTQILAEGDEIKFWARHVMEIEPARNNPTKSNMSETGLGAQRGEVSDGLNLRMQSAGMPHTPRVV